MEKYFSMNDDGRLYFIGTFKSWNEAEEAAAVLTGKGTIQKFKHGSVYTKRSPALWIFNETEARSWADFLNEELQK